MSPFTVYFPLQITEPTMTNLTNTPSHEKRFSRRFLRNFLVVTIIIGVVVVPFGYYYRCHLSWKYVEWRYELQKEKTIPNCSIPEVEVPCDWIEHSLGNLRFRVPPDFVINKEITTRVGINETDIVLQNGSYAIAATLTPVCEDTSALLNAVSCIYFQDSKKPLTSPRLRLECCIAGADKFRWSMSPKDVARNAFFVTLRSSYGVYGQSAETFFYDDIDRILFFYENRAMIDWQSTSTTDAGYMHVINRVTNDSEHVEYDHVLAQRICQSITLSPCPSDVPPSENTENAEP